MIHISDISFFFYFLIQVNPSIYGRDILALTYSMSKKAEDKE